MNQHQECKEFKFKRTHIPHHHIHVPKLKRVKQGSKELSYYYPTSFLIFFTNTSFNSYIPLQSTDVCSFYRFLSPCKVTRRKIKGCFLTIQFQINLQFSRKISVKIERKHRQCFVLELFSSTGPLLLYFNYNLSIDWRQKAYYMFLCIQINILRRGFSIKNQGIKGTTSRR